MNESKMKYIKPAVGSPEDFQGFFAHVFAILFLAAASASVGAAAIATYRARRAVRRASPALQANIRGNITK
ncbi:MAG: hypothetical protein AB1414_12095 [bacterium]